MNLLLWTICFVPLICVCEAKIYRCVSTPYDTEKQGCCNGKVYQKEKDNLECCNGTIVYSPGEQTCCGNQVRNKRDIEDLVCCENHFRQKNRGKCCRDIYYEDGTTADECCGNLLNTGGYYCCNGQLRRKLPSMECCKGNSEMYNSSTHWCRKDQILHLGEDICYGKRYTTKTQICCRGDRKIYNKNRKEDTDNKCNIETATAGHLCGNVKIDTQTQGCCHGNPYDILNEKCCGETVLAHHEKCCNGQKLDTGRYTCCQNEEQEQQVKKSEPHHDKCCFLQNGSVQTYNSNSNVCSNALGKVIPNVPMCGIFNYNKANDLCCDGKLVVNGQPLKMNCCGVNTYHTETQTCDSGEIKALNESKTNIQEPYCGKDVYNTSKDLCCNGQLYRGEKKNKSCCGVTTFFKRNQTCYDGTTIMKKSCPLFCKSIWRKNPRRQAIWKNIKNLKDYMLYSIKYKNSNWTVVSKQLPQKIIYFKKNCKCVYGKRRKLLMVAKRVTKAGTMRGQYFLMPNKKKNKKFVFEHLLKKDRKQKVNKKYMNKKNRNQRPKKKKEKPSHKRLQRNN